MSVVVIHALPGGVLVPGHYRRLFGYHLAIGLAGSAAVLWSAPRLRIAEPAGLAVFTALLFGSEAMSIRLPSGLNTTASLSVMFAMFLLFGSGLTAAAGMLVSVVESRLLLMRPAAVALFNGGQYVLSIYAGAALAQLNPLPVAEPTLLDPGSLLNAGLFCAGFFTVNHALTNLPMVVVGRVKPRDMIDAAAIDALMWAITIPFSFIQVAVYRSLGAWTLLTMAIPIIGVASMFGLQASLARANREMSALYEASRRLGLALDLDRVFDLVVDCVQDAVGADSCLLFSVKDPGRQLELVRQHFRIECDTAVVLDMGSRAAGRLTSGRGEITSENSGGRTYHLLSVPMTHEDRVTGAIVVGRQVGLEFTSDDLRMLSILAGHAAVSIEHALEFRHTATLADTEPLTGLYNSRGFSRVFEQELTASKRQSRPLALIFLDLDQFKWVNDALGHLAGDHVLKEFGSVLKRSVRENDIAARLGGDEFVVLLPGTGRVEAQQVAQRIRSTVAAARFPCEGRPEGVSVGVSTGVACYPEDGEDLRMLIKAADQAMYHEKTSTVEGLVQ